MSRMPGSALSATTGRPGASWSSIYSRRLVIASSQRYGSSVMKVRAGMVAYSTTDELDRDVVARGLRVGADLVRGVDELLGLALSMPGSFTFSSASME